MGLPMWKEPEDEAILDAAAKLDRAAATRRSAIRREPSVRPGRDPGVSRGLREYIRNRHQTSRHQDMLRTRDRLRQEDRETEQQIAQLQTELDRLRQARLRSRARISQELEGSRAARESIQNSPVDQSAAVDETSVTPNDQAAEPADTIRQHLPRPPRESGLRFEVLYNPTSSRPSSPWRYQVLPRTSLPSPPDSAGGAIRDRSVPDGPAPFDEGLMPALTEGFAPAQAASQTADGDGITQTVGDVSPLPEDWESSYPPLQRVGRASPRQIPRVDGLGDRRRSLSPLSDVEEDIWASLLTHMDAGRSSTSTSFASGISDSHVRSGRSSHNTSFGEIGSAEDTCDLDLPPGITAEDVLEVRARHRSTHESNPMTGRRGLQEHQDRIAGRVEVGMFRAILDRMRRREEIPEEWWASVGSSPDFGRS